jgi:hypothetical protein
MDLTHYDLGHLDQGSAVFVTLSGSAANVRLMDGPNLSSYRSARQYRFVGGARPSSCRSRIPAHGMSPWTCRACAAPSGRASKSSGPDTHTRCRRIISPRPAHH